MSILHQWGRLAAAASCLGGGFHSAYAETTAQFQVTASIEAGCLVDGVGSNGNAGTVGILDFGRDSTFSTATRMTSLVGSQSIRLRCTPGLSVSMTIDGGQHAALGSRQLQLQDGDGDRIGYGLCADAACSQPIPIGGGASMAVTGSNENDVLLPVYGVLTLPGDLPAGTYTDTLLITLSW